MTRGRVLAVLAAAGLGGGAAASCQLVAGLDWSIADAGADAGTGGAPGADGGPGDASSEEAGPPSGCGGPTYPDPPGGTDSTMTIPGLVFALRTIDLGDMGDTPGYDLDDVCTCTDDAGPSCVGASPQPSTYCDAPGGVDDQAAKLFQLIELPVGSGSFGSAYFSAKANEGAWSLLVRLDGYSGMPDDPAVQVSLYDSAGLLAPKWQGADAWPVTPGSVFVDAGVVSPRFTSSGAYVAGSVLVATLPTCVLTLRGGGVDQITIQLSAGVLTGKLVQMGGAWSLEDGVLAARWSLTDVFRSLSSYRDNNGQPICTNATTYSIAKGVICSDADILVDGTQPKSAACDALSFGLGFTADPALVGPVGAAGATPDGCSPASDPALDSCP